MGIIFGKRHKILWGIAVTATGFLSLTSIKQTYGLRYLNRKPSSSGNARLCLFPVMILYGFFYLQPGLDCHCLSIYILEDIV